MKKICTKCDEEKDIGEFVTRKDRKTTHRSYCKKCDSKRVIKVNQLNKDNYNAYGREYYKRNPYRFRGYRYKISPDRIKELEELQNHKCAICFKDFEGKFFIDHDHKTEVVRGLLCRHCNFVLGHAFDNSEILISAARYLEL